MASDMAISIVIVFSPRPRQVVEIPMTIAPGFTAAQALMSAAYLGESATHGLEVTGLGVWGRKIVPSYLLQDQDRLEVYRSLTVDPKVARRERFVKQGAKKAAGLFAKRRIGAKAGY